MNLGLFNEAIRRARAALLSRRVRLSNAGQVQCKVCGCFISEGAPCAHCEKVANAVEFVYGPRRVGSTPVYAEQMERAAAAFKADEGLRARYGDVEGLFKAAKSVQKSKLDAIARGYASKCLPHEAIAYLASSPSVKDSFGVVVEQPAELIEHYVFGSRRGDNESKVQNLANLPFANKAIREGHRREKVSPNGTKQLEYTLPRQGFFADALCQVDIIDSAMSGKEVKARLSGWRFQRKKSAERRP